MFTCIITAVCSLPLIVLYVCVECITADRVRFVFQLVCFTQSAGKRVAKNSTRNDIVIDVVLEL